MRTGEHFYKGYAIRNAKEKLRLTRSVFHIIPNLGRGIEDPIDATRTLRSAKQLIDVWDEATICACGQDPLPHEHRCWKCLEKRLSVTHGGRPPKSAKHRKRGAA